MYLHKIIYVYIYMYVCDTNPIKSQACFSPTQFLIFLANSRPSSRSSRPGRKHVSPGGKGPEMPQEMVLTALCCRRCYALNIKKCWDWMRLMYVILPCYFSSNHGLVEPMLKENHNETESGSLTHTLEKRTETQIAVWDHYLHNQRDARTEVFRRKQFPTANTNKCN